MSDTPNDPPTPGPPEAAAGSPWPPPPPPVLKGDFRRVLGKLLFACGILIMGGSGICTLCGTVVALSDVEPSVIWAVLAFGVPPFLIGFGLVKWGRWLRRTADAAQVSPPVDVP